MKKLFCLLIAILLLAAGCALAEEIWDFNTNDYALTGYSGTGGDVVIPETIEGCTVDIIGVGAFNPANEITSIVLPETVRQVEDSAISFGDELTALELNEGLMIIGDNCFSRLDLLEELTIPASVCYIGNYSFDSCGMLRSVTFTGECPVFAGIAFDYIADDAVIYVPDDRFDAYTAAFNAMGNPVELQPSGKNAEIYDFSVDPELFGIDEETGTVYCYDAYVVRMDVPAEIGGVAVRAIDAEAFYGNPYLCWVSLPEGVEIIGDSAFEDCTRLVHADLPSTLKTIGKRAFAGGMKARSLILPEGLESIGDEAFYWAIRMMNVELPSTLKTIGAGAFDGCSWLEEVYIPASVETIGEKAFANSSIGYVVFEGLELPEMPESIFENCWYLADIDLHTRASKQQMLDLQAVVDELGLSCRVWRMQNPDVDYIGDGLDSYENGVMTGYSGQQTHVRPWDTYDDITVTGLGDGAFANNTYIEYFAVPYNDAFTTIGAEAFANSSLMQIDLFDSVTTINCGAFRNCTELKELVLPESVEFVGVESLNGCTGLEKLIVLCDPTILPEDLLQDCSATMEVYASPEATDEQVKYLSTVAGRAFYEPVTRLGEEAPELYACPYEPLPAEDFWYDTEYARLDRYDGYELNLVLPSVIDDTMMTMIGGGMMSRASYGDNFEVELPVVSLVIPQGYREIPPYAFENCETLETVVCYAPIEMLSDCAFANCTSLREVIFVNGVHSIGQYVFDNCPNLETVYIGQYAENIDETAFLNMDGGAAFDASACITDPALLPDIDALLEAVRRDPMPEPEPEPVPVAEPVGEEGAPFFGVWHGREIVLEGTVYSFADFEMVMTILLSEDGRLVVAESDTIDMSLVGDGDWLAWRVEDGAAIADQYIMTIQEDGRLCLEEEGLQMLFEYDAEAVIPELPAAVPAAPAVEPAAPAESAGAAPTGADFLEVKFVCVNADVDGYTLDAAMLGGEYSIVLHENGTTDFVMVGTAVPGVLWSMGENGNVLLDYYGTIMELVWTDAGFDMNYFDTMLMHFAAQG